MVLFAVYGFDYKLFSDNLKEFCEKIKYIYFADRYTYGFPSRGSCLRSRLMRCSFSFYAVRSGGSASKTRTTPQDMPTAHSLIFPSDIRNRAPSRYWGHLCFIQKSVWITDFCLVQMVCGQWHINCFTLWFYLRSHRT